MNRYKIYCTEEQTKKALELGAPIKLFCKDYMHGHINYMGNPIPIGHVLIHNDLYYAPTTDQMIGWLEEQGELKVIAIHNSKNLDWSFHITTKDKDVFTSIGYSSRKQATLAAIDAALEYLETHNN